MLSKKSFGEGWCLVAFCLFNTFLFLEKQNALVQLTTLFIKLPGLVRHDWMSIKLIEFDSRANLAVYIYSYHKDYIYLSTLPVPIAKLLKTIPATAFPRGVSDIEKMVAYLACNNAEECHRERFSSLGFRNTRSRNRTASVSHCMGPCSITWNRVK